MAVREFGAADSIEALTEFLHRGYSSLAELGFRYFATYQSADETRRRLADATCLVAVLEDRIVGTITLYLNRRGTRCSWYNRNGVAYFGQFAVDPALRDCGLGSSLLGTVEDLGRENGAEELALDTAEGATHLLHYYRKRGYRFIEYVQWDVTNYRSVVMSKPLTGG